MPFDSREQSPVMILGVLNFSSPALSFFAMNPRTFCASVSALQPTVELATFAACASVGNDSARVTTNRCLFIKLSRSFPPNEVLLIEENNYRRISVLKSPLFPPHRGSSHRKTLPTASATIKGFEVMRMIRKRQCLMLGRVPTEAFCDRLFRLAA